MASQPKVEETRIPSEGPRSGNDNGNPITVNTPRTETQYMNGFEVGRDEDLSSSSSSSSSLYNSESSSSEGEVSEKTQLIKAGVELDLDTLAPPSGTGAPLQLVSEFVSCCVREEYRAALILCRKVLEFEPDNATAQEFLPTLQERLKLDKELPTESSSEGTSDDESTSSDSSHDRQADATSAHHNCHH